MAYRFLREGLYTRRQPLRRNGFTPFIEDLMWEATDWHYQHYMRRVARASLLTHQEGIDAIVDTFRKCSKGGLAKGTDRLFFVLQLLTLFLTAGKRIHSASVRTTALVGNYIIVSLNVIQDLTDHVSLAVPI